MARAAMGAGDLAAPNSSLAGGPVGLTTFFLGTGFLAATRIGLAAEPPSCATITLGAPAATASAHKMLVERMPPLHLSDSQCCSSLRALRLMASIGRCTALHSVFSELSLGLAGPVPSPPPGPLRPSAGSMRQRSSPRRRDRESAKAPHHSGSPGCWRGP